MLFLLLVWTSCAWHALDVTVMIIGKIIIWLHSRKFRSHDTQIKIYRWHGTVSPFIQTVPNDSRLDKSSNLELLCKGNKSLYNQKSSRRHGNKWVIIVSVRFLHQQYHLLLRQFEATGNDQFCIGFRKFTIWRYEGQCVKWSHDLICLLFVKYLGT